MEPEKRRSNFWYILPIILGIIGGIVAYFGLRNDDRKKAKNCIYIGLIQVVIGIIIDLVILSSGIVEEQFSINI